MVQKPRDKLLINPSIFIIFKCLKIKMMKELIEKMALLRFPEYWCDEPNNHSMCAKEIDTNKEEREAFIEGALCFLDLLKESISIELSSETIIDYGDKSTCVTASIYVGIDKISSSSISL